MLQNPGLEAPTKLDFDTWPSLAEFFAFGGVPGVKYLYLLHEEQPRAQEEGWDTVVRMPLFRVKGVPMLAMATGDPIIGASPGSSICELYVSKLAMQKTGLTAVPEPTKPLDKLNSIIDNAKKRDPESKKSS